MITRQIHGRSILWLTSLKLSSNDCHLDKFLMRRQFYSALIAHTKVVMEFNCTKIKPLWHCMVIIYRWSFRSVWRYLKHSKAVIAWCYRKYIERNLYFWSQSIWFLSKQLTCISLRHVSVIQFKELLSYVHLLWLT